MKDAVIPHAIIDIGVQRSLSDTRTSNTTSALLTCISQLKGVLLTNQNGQEDRTGLS
jgi:hypothetical protein